MKCITQVTKRIPSTDASTARTRSIANCDTKPTSWGSRQFLMEPSSTISEISDLGFLLQGRPASGVLLRKRASLREMYEKPRNFLGSRCGINQPCRVYHRGYRTARRSPFRNYL